MVKNEILSGILIVFIIVFLVVVIVGIIFVFILGSIYYFKFYKQKIRLLEVLTEKKKQEMMKYKDKNSKNKEKNNSGKNDLLEKIDDFTTQRILEDKIKNY